MTKNPVIYKSLKLEKRRKSDKPMRHSRFPDC